MGHFKSEQSGHGSDLSPGNRVLIRRDQQAEERLAILRKALVEGELSGEPKSLDMSAIKAAGRQRMKAAD